MSGRNKLADIPGKPLPERQSNLLADLWDEATGAFARYGRRSGAQRDASLAMLNQAVDPNTDPLTGAGMKALGLAGLVTHPLAFFPTGDEWRERLSNAGNTSRLGQSIGGMLGDLPGLIDPQLLAGGGVLAAAPLVGKLAKPGLGKGLGDLMQDAASNKELDALGARLQAEAAQVGGSPSAVSRDQALQGLVGGGKMPAMEIKTLQDARAAHSKAAEIAQEMGFKPAERSDAFTGSSYQDFTVFAKDGKILGPDDPRGPGTKYVSFRIRSADHPEPPSRINNGFGADFSFEPAGKFDEQAFREFLQSKLDKATKK